MRSREAAERRFAEFYRIWAEGFDQDAAIYLDLAAKYPGPVLEIGCQAGRVIARLAEAGYEAQGIDTNRPMLELAQSRLRPWSERARVIDFDLRHGALAERFNIALVTMYAFNALIDVEEQRLFLRHLQRSMRAPGLVAIDLFCPLSFVRPEDSGEWRTLEREVDGRKLVVRDKRDMLTPLLERRTQAFRIDAGAEEEHEVHRRYVTPQHAAGLLTEAGFENVRWIRSYDPSTAEPVTDESRPDGPFLLIAEL